MCVCLNGRGDVNELALSVWLSLSKRTSLGGLSVVLPWPCGTGLSGPLEAAAAAASEEEEDEEDEEDGDAAVEWEATVEAVGADTGAGTAPSPWTATGTTAGWAVYVVATTNDNFSPPMPCLARMYSTVWPDRSTWHPSNHTN